MTDRVDRERDRAETDRERIIRERSSGDIKHYVGRSGICIRLAKTGMCDEYCLDDHLKRWRNIPAMPYKRDTCTYGDKCQYVVNECAILCPYYHAGINHNAAGYRELMQSIIFSAQRRSEELKASEAAAKQLAELTIVHDDLRQRNQALELKNAQLLYRIRSYENWKRTNDGGMLPAYP